MALPFIAGQQCSNWLESNYKTTCAGQNKDKTRPSLLENLGSNDWKRDEIGWNILNCDTLKNVITHI